MNQPEDPPTKGAEICPVCLAKNKARHLESYTEPIFSRQFEIFLCKNCGVTFSPSLGDFPLTEWYSKASYLYGELEYSVRPQAAADWRFAHFNKTAKKQRLQGNLLDVGCGDGRFLAQQYQRGWVGTLKGLDFSTEMARRAPKGCEIEVAPLENFVQKRAANPFDAVTLFDVLEHFPNPAATLTEIKKLIKPMGHLVVTVPNGERFRFSGREEFDYPPNHFTRWTAAALNGLVSRGGFDVVELTVSPCRPAEISEQIFYPIFWAAMPWIKRILFGSKAASGKKTLAELLTQEVPNTAPGARPRGLKAFIADRAVRKKMENMLRRTFNIVLFPLLFLVCLIVNVVRPRSGVHLFLLARRNEHPNP